MESDKDIQVNEHWFIDNDFHNSKILTIISNTGIISVRDNEELSALFPEDQTNFFVCAFWEM
jgi:hypothetical protein